MRLIAGLGNPGEPYRATRHNLGYRVVDELARRRRIALARQQCHAAVGWDEELLLAAPLTYMNRSGHALRCLVELHELALDRLLIVYDDLNLPFGKLRLRLAGSPGGHRGMESVVDSLQSTAVPRLRLGIGPAPESRVEDDLSDWVLSPFPVEQEPEVAALVGRAADACEAWTREEAALVMSRFNG